MRDFTLFISYSQHDGRQYAERLSKLFRSVFPDIRIFWDRQLLAGEVLWDKLHEEVRHCNVFLYLVSDESTTMPSGCIQEFSWARLYEKQAVPCIMPTYSGDPSNISGLPELSELLYIDLRKGIENCAGELATLYGAIYELIVSSSPITQYHRQEMMMLYEILGKLSDSKHEHEEYRVGAEVYKRGYEFEYDDYPLIEGNVSQAICLEVIDMLDMMNMLQRAWAAFTDVERKRIENETRETAEFTIKQVGFCGNEEGDHLSYMRFLNKCDKFTWLSYANGNGNSHKPNVRPYRAMLQVYSHIKRDDTNDFYAATGRLLLSVDEVIQIVHAQHRAMLHPL